MHWVLRAWTQEITAAAALTMERIPGNQAQMPTKKLQRAPRA